MSRSSRDSDNDTSLEARPIRYNVARIRIIHRLYGKSFVLVRVPCTHI